MTDRPNRAAALAIIGDMADAKTRAALPVRLASLRSGDVAGARLDGIDTIVKAIGKAVPGADDLAIQIETRPDGSASLAARARREGADVAMVDYEAERAQLEFWRVAGGGHG